MFSVQRQDLPDPNIIKNNYKHPDAVIILKRIFYGKCYLCERGNLNSAQVEHFRPHKNDPLLKFEWKNLYWACIRCNGIKGATHINLLDCCDTTLNIQDKIQCVAPSIPDDPVFIAAAPGHTDLQTANTVKLLSECYNLANTGLRSSDREELMQELYNELCVYMSHSAIIRDHRSTTPKRNESIEKIIEMWQPNYPFSAFWRWHVRRDSKLLSHFNKHLD